MIETLFACVVIYVFVTCILVPVIGGLVALYETVRDHVRFTRSGRR